MRRRSRLFLLIRYGEHSLIRWSWFFPCRAKFDTDSVADGFAKDIKGGSFF